MTKSYIRCRWIHDHSDEAVLLYSELDDERWETRKVYIFRDERIEWADHEHHTDYTELGLDSVPSLDEINLDKEFDAQEISQQEFEDVWSQARAEKHEHECRSRRAP